MMIRIASETFFKLFIIKSFQIEVVRILKPKAEIYYRYIFLRVKPVEDKKYSLFYGEEESFIVKRIRKCSN